MHPIERLRYVARSDGAGAAILVRETALALCDMAFDPQSLVLACRRIVERHPTTAQLWWLCAHVLTAADPFERARELALVVEHDDTPGHLDDSLPDDAEVVIVGWPSTTVRCLAQRGDATMLVVDSHGEGEALVDRLHHAEIAAELVPAECVGAAVAQCDAVVVEALATGAGAALAVGASRGVVETARTLGKPTMLVAGVGTRMPDVLWQGMLAALGMPDDWRAGLDVIEVSRFTRVIGPEGATDAASASFADALAPECPPASELLRRSAI